MSSFCCASVYADVVEQAGRIRVAGALGGCRAPSRPPPDSLDCSAARSHACHAPAPGRVRPHVDVRSPLRRQDVHGMQTLRSERVGSGLRAPWEDAGHPRARRLIHRAAPHRILLWDNATRGLVDNSTEVDTKSLWELVTPALLNHPRPPTPHGAPHGSYRCTGLGWDAAQLQS